MATDNTVEVLFSADTSGLDRGILTAGNELKTLRTELATVGTAAVPATEMAAEGMGGLTFATAQARREVIVLGHELISGNFARIPGSLMVLGERMGGVSLATIGWGAAIGAVGFALFELASNAEHTAESVNQMQAAMEAEGKTTVAKDQLESYIDTLAKLPGISKSAAREITESFQEAGNVSQTSAEKLMSIVNDYAFVVNEKAPKAAQDLIKMSEDPMKAAEKLSETYKGILTPAQFEAIQGFTTMGDKMAAMDVLADALQTHFANLKENGLTPAQEAANGLSNALGWVGDKIGSIIGLIPRAAAAMNELSASFAGVGKESVEAACWVTCGPAVPQRTAISLACGAFASALIGRIVT